MLGSILKDARERQNLTIQDLENETSIRRAYIAAIEEEDWDALPSPVYVKGFIRNLSNFLNVDSLPLIDEYIDILNGKSGAPTVSETQVADESKKTDDKPKETKTSLSGLSGRERSLKKKSKGSAFLTVFLILALIGAGAFYFMNKNGDLLPGMAATTSSEETSQKSEKVETEAKAVKESPKPKPTKVTEKLPSTNATQSESQNANQTPQTTEQTADGVEITAAFDGSCWTKVVVDGNVVFEDIAEDGSVHTWKGKDKISVVAGNAGAMNITHNGKKVGAMGAYGQVAEKVFTK